MGRHIQDFRRGSIVAGMDFNRPIKFNARCRPRNSEPAPFFPQELI